MHITLTGTGSPGGDRPDIIATSFARLLRERIVGTPSRFAADTGARPAGVALRVEPRADESEAFEVAVVDAEARPLLLHLQGALPHRRRVLPPAVPRLRSEEPRPP